MEQNTKNYSTLYIVRHGETDWNVKKIIQGHTDTPLNEHGKAQAMLLSQTLKHIRFDQIFSSDLQRAKHTAEIIAVEHSLPVSTTHLLREKKFGYVEGKHISALGELDAIFDTLSDDEKSTYKHNPDAESDIEAMNRTLPFLQNIAVGSPGKHNLIVTHGGVIKNLLLHFGFFRYDTVRRYIIENTAYIVIVSDGIDFFVRETHGIKEKRI